MSNEDIRKFKKQLCSAPLFEGTQGYQLEIVIKASMVVEYNANQIIFERGDRANGFFIILEGKVKIHTQSINFIELGQGKYFGEYALIENKLHSSTVTAVSNCRCLVIPPDIFNNLLQQNLPFSNRLLKSLIRRLRSKDKLEISLTQKNKEISNQNLEIRDKNQKIREQNERIHESIEYAGMIQSTMLPSEKLLELKLEDFFLIFHPKEKVSGDFYWFAQIENKYCIAIADCTGHGVPGSMISILGISFLNEIINQIKTPIPGEILTKLNSKMQNALSQNREKYQSNDGMDISIIIVDFERMKLSYAGAQNPMYLLRNCELSVFEPDKVNVGTAPHSFQFTTHDAFLNNKDMIYLFTDGVVDQLGTDEYKRFGTSKLKKILAQTANQNTQVQEQIILDHFLEWRGNNKQTDDMTLLGLKI